MSNLLVNIKELISFYIKRRDRRKKRKEIEKSRLT